MLWLMAAKARGDAKTDWLERVYQLAQNNDYSVLDPLLSNSHILLNKEKLQQLTVRYEAEFHQVLKTNNANDRLNWGNYSA